jgi:hypothetical protein
MQAAFAQTVPDGLHNYMVDPGFEDGTAFTEQGYPGWNYWVNEGFSDDIYPHSGTWCGGLPADPPDWSCGFGQWVGGLTAGARYIATAFGRLAEYDPADPNEWGLYIGVQQLDGTLFPGNKVQKQVFDPEYQPVILFFAMGDTNTGADVWAWKGPGGEATVDDYGVWDYHNYLNNPDFEAGALTGWDYWGGYSSGCFVDPGEKNGGAYGGGIGDGEGGFGQWVSELAPNTTYCLNGWAKVENDGDIAYVGVKNHGNPEVSFQIQSTVWTEGTVAFTTGAENTGAEVYFWKGSGEKAYCDDLTVCLMVEGPTTHVQQDGIGIPQSFFLGQNFPNPFNPATTIAYAVPVKGRVRLSVGDIRGRETVTLVDAVQNAGAYTAVFDASSAASGVYFYRLETEGAVITKKMTVIK